MVAAPESPWLIAVCAGRWQRHGIRCARAAGLRVLALDGDPQAPGFEAADRRAVVDVRDVQAVLGAVAGANIVPSGAIAFAAEAGMAAAAALREHYGLPGPGSEVTALLTNKCLQRAAWDAAGLPNPRWRRYTNEAEASASIEAIGLPVMIKPADGAGSRAVRRINGNEPWREHALAALTASRMGAAIVESVLPGVEFAVETFSRNGRCEALVVTAKRKVPGTDNTVADQLATPNLPVGRIDAIAELACEALAALGYRDGPGHVEIMADENLGLGLVEAAGRGGGFMVFDRMVPLASGYDLATASAVQAVGRMPEPPPTARNAVALRFLSTRPGIVTRLEGFDAANAIEGVETGPIAAVGDRVGMAASDGDRLCYILSCAAGSAEALALADRAEALIEAQIDCKPEHTARDITPVAPAGTIRLEKGARRA